jgi:hypothetical protein
MINYFPDPHVSGHQIRNLREEAHDPYHNTMKLSEPTVCSQCGAVYHDGRWKWASIFAITHKDLCPACQRIQDHCPAGFLTLSGAFLSDHKFEILSLIHNISEREKAEHALKRIIQIVDSGSELEITCTDPHLARSLGEAVHHAYQGLLDIDYQKGEFLLRVKWQR